MFAGRGSSRDTDAKGQTGLAIPSRCWLFALVSISCAVATTSSLAHDASRSRVFGFLPVVSTERLATRFDPLVAYLTNELGLEITLETAPTYAEFVRRTQTEQRYDYLLTAPHFYFVAQRRAGYRVMARVDVDRAHGSIVVRRDSGMSDIGDLCGRSIATPDSMALLTLLIQEQLLDAGCDLEGSTRLVPTPSHNAALMSVYQRATDGAAVGNVPLGNADAGMRAEISIVAETRDIPSMPLSVAPWISRTEAARFADALISLGESPEGADLLEHLGWNGFVSARPEEYDVLEDYAPMAGEP